MAAIPRYSPAGPSSFKIEPSDCLRLTVEDEQEEGPIACIRVLSVSTGNMAMCSTDPATDPATMNCQNKRPSWEGGGGERVISVGWNLVEGVAVVVVVVVAIGGGDEREGRWRCGLKWKWGVYYWAWGIAFGVI